MAFVRKKRVHNYEYYELVENRWTNGQPRQRVLVLTSEGILPPKLLYSSGWEQSSVYIVSPRSGTRKLTNFRRTPPPTQRLGHRPS